MWILTAAAAYCVIGALYLWRLWKAWPPEKGTVCVPGVILAVLLWPILFVVCDLLPGGRDA